MVGLGLLGGSLAAGLRQLFPQIEITAVDAPEVLASSEAKALVHRGINRQSDAAVREAMASSDLVFLAATIGGIEHWLPRALEAAALVTDCGSTKRRLVDAGGKCARASRYVPGHPMAGALGGLSGASADLFKDQPWVLCPQGTEASGLQAVTHLIEALGGRPVEMSASEHDRVVATTSHVPRLMASSLARIASRATAFGAAGPAFERLVRGAGGSTAMWKDILGSNRDEVAACLRLLIADLTTCAQELEADQPLDEVLTLLQAAEQARLAFENS